MKRLLLCVFCLSIVTVCYADEPVGFKGTILFSDGQEIAFEYLGTLTGPKEYNLIGEIGDRDVSYPLSSFKTIHFITPDGSNTRHAEVVGLTGKKVTITDVGIPGADKNYKDYFPSFVYLDALTGTREIHSNTVFKKISVVTIDSQSGQYKWNPATKQYYPGYYLYDPYDGTSLQWVGQPPQAQSEQSNQTRIRQSAIPSQQSRQSQLQTTKDNAIEREIAIARSELKEAEDALWKAYEEAEAAYNDLKSTKGTEVFPSIESALTESFKTAGEGLQEEVALIAIEREVGQAVSIEAGKQTATFLGFIGAAKTYLDIGEWLAKDSVLIAGNVKTNWLTLTKVWPAKQRYDEAKKKLETLESL